MDNGARRHDRGQGGGMRLIVALVVLAGLGSGPVPATAADYSAVRRGDVLGALEVLHDWDERRARAWANSDEVALRSLYVRGSAAARSDVRLLRSYTARGLVVRRMVTQVFGVRVLTREPGRLAIRVRDRVAGGLVDTGERDVALPSTRPATRRIELRQVAGTWKVVAVTR